MDNYRAVEIAEGFGAPCESEEGHLAAWQHLVDTGLAWKLQGWVGRTAKAMIDNGLIQPAVKRSAEECPTCFAYSNCTCD